MEKQVTPKSIIAVAILIISIISWICSAYTLDQLKRTNTQLQLISQKIDKNTAEFNQKLASQNQSIIKANESLQGYTKMNNIKCEVDASECIQLQFPTKMKGYIVKQATWTGYKFEAKDICHTPTNQELLSNASRWEDFDWQNNYSKSAWAGTGWSIDDKK